MTENKSLLDGICQNVNWTDVMKIVEWKHSYTESEISNCIEDDFTEKKREEDSFEFCDSLEEPQNFGATENDNTNGTMNDSFHTARIDSENESTNGIKLKFRVSCRLTGSWRRKRRKGSVSTY